MENKYLSNLTQEEQAYINSKEFIEKFGDWKKAQRLEKLKSAEPIITDGKVFLDGEEISAEIETLRLEGNSKILKILAQNIGNTIKGTYTNLDTKEEFYVGTKTFKEIRRHNTLDEEHIAAIAYIPEIIKKGIYIDKSANENPERYPDVKEWQYYVAGIKINSEDYTVKAAIRVDLDNNKYYDQHLSHIEKGKLLDIINEKNKLVAVNPVNTQDSNELNENTESNTLSQNTKTTDMLENILSDIDDKRLIYICQVPQLPYLDENLEPTKETIQAVKEGRLYFVTENQVEKIVNTTATQKITPERNQGQEKITGVRHTPSTIEQGMSEAAAGISTLSEKSLEGSTPLSQNPKGNTAVAISDVNDNSNIAQNENLSIDKNSRSVSPNLKNLEKVLTTWQQQYVKTKDDVNVSRSYGTVWIDNWRITGEKHDLLDWQILYKGTPIIKCVGHEANYCADDYVLTKDKLNIGDVLQLVEKNLGAYCPQIDRESNAKSHYTPSDRIEQKNQMPKENPQQKEITRRHSHTRDGMEW